MDKYMCTACPGEKRQFTSANWPQHVKSKAHQEAGGDEMSYWMPEGDTPSQVAENLIAAAAADIIEADENEAPPVEAEGEDIPVPDMPDLDDDTLLARFSEDPAEEEDSEVARLRFELAEARAEIEEANRRAAEWRPDVDVAVYNTPEEAYQFFGKEKLGQIAERRLAKMNKDRIKEGLPPLYTGDPAEYRRLLEEEVVAICKEMVSRKNSIKNANRVIAQRTLKMVKPDGNMVQIPVELQINNGQGSLYDPIARYKEKGFKLPSPTRCNFRDCWDPSAIHNGKYLFGGYCSQEHQQMIEGDDGKNRNNGRETRALDLAARV